jgi:hypothetical protein
MDAKYVGKILHVCNIDIAAAVYFRGGGPRNTIPRHGLAELTPPIRRVSRGVDCWVWCLEGGFSRHPNTGSQSSPLHLISNKEARYWFWFVDRGAPRGRSVLSRFLRYFNPQPSHLSPECGRMDSHLTGRKGPAPVVLSEALFHESPLHPFPGSPLRCSRRGGFGGVTGSVLSEPIREML